MLAELLFGIHLALLLRQSLLLLRPAFDRPLAGKAKHTVKKRPYCSPSVFGPPSYMQRIRHHGSGAALAFLPLLLYLFFRPYGHSIHLPTFFVVCSALWLGFSLLALSATRFQRYNGIAFSTRDTGPADFGRRWPFWPDGALWLSELSYLILVYVFLYLATGHENSSFYSAFIVLSRILLGLALFYVLWRNFCYIQIHYPTLWPKLCSQKLRHPKLPLRESRREAEVLELQKIVDNAQECLYILKLQTKPHTEVLTAGFYMLRFLGAEAAQLPRQQQNDHPLSLLSWQRADSPKEGPETAKKESAQRTILEFALELQGFLQYIPQEAMTPRKKIQLWGPYYDIQADFFQPYISAGESQHPLLFVVCQSGYSPLLQLLQSLEFHVLELTIICLQLQSQPASEEYWQFKLQRYLDAAHAAQEKRLPKVHIHRLKLPISLEKELLRCAAQSLPKSKREKRWREYQAERGREVFSEELRSLLALVGKQMNWLYRGPYALQNVIEETVAEFQ